MLAAASGCPGLQALNPVCQVGTVVGKLGGSVASAGINAVLGGLSQWVASGAEWLLGQIGAALESTTNIDLGADWFQQNYHLMTALAAIVVLPLLLVSAMQAIYRQSPSQVLRTFLVQLPLALLLGVVAVQVVALCLSATDALCSAVAGGAGSSVDTLLSTLSQGLVAAVGDPGLAAFVLLLVGLLVATASFVLWLELLVRAAAVYVAALFLPMAMITLVWPSIAHWSRRLVETLAALILSKFVIVATLSLAAGAVSSGVNGGDGSGASDFAAVLAGGALLVLATFAPFALLRLIPMVEAGAIAHLEGVRQRATAAVTRVPRSAASFALGAGMDSLGAARVMAGMGTDGGGGGGGGVGGSEDGGAAAGGIPLLSGGDPESLDHLHEAVANPAPPDPARKGRKPVLGAGAPATAPPSGAAEGETPPPTTPRRATLELSQAGPGEALPDDFNGWAFTRGPGHTRHYWGSDEHGPVFRSLPPYEPEADT
jgi:hypothetical protein